MGFFDKMKEKNEAKAEKERVVKEEKLKEFENAWHPGPEFDFDAELPYSDDQGDLVEAYQASTKEFPLNGAIVSFSEEFDRFNDLTSKIASWADKYSAKLQRRCTDEIHDLPSLWDNLGPIYMDALYPPMKMGHQTLIMHDIWDVSFEQFYRASISEANFVKQLYSTVTSGVNQLAEKNYARVNSEELTANKYRDLVMDGFMAKQASKGVGAASVVSFLETTGVTDVIKKTQNKSLNEEARAVTSEQSELLYSRIQNYDFFGWLTFLMKSQIMICESSVLVSLLNASGFSIDTSFTENNERVKVMLSNLSEAIPKEKARDVIVKALVACPYEPLVWEYIDAYIGDTEEAKAISAYLDRDNETKRLLVDESFAERQSKRWGSRSLLD